MAHKNKTNWSPYKDRQEKRRKAASQISSLDGSSNKGTELKGKHKKPESIFSVEEANDRLYDIFRNHGVDYISHDQRHKLAQFYRLLMLNQEHQNFTRLLKLRDIAIRHFIDSAIVTRFTELQFPLMDVGTGPGFPGIPLKILYPDQRILLAEGVQKRVEFLKQVRDELSLDNLPIFGKNISRYFYCPTNGVITRAVEDMSNTLGNVISSIQVGGKVYFMKGPNVDPEIKPALQKWGEFYNLSQDIAYDLPYTTHHRRLIVFEKIAHPELANEEEQDFPLLENE